MSYSRFLPPWFLWLAVSLLGAAASGAPEPLAGVRPPGIAPDYSEIVIPPNLAPLNFKVEEPGRRYKVQIDSKSGSAINMSSRSPSIRIPAQPWAELLKSNAGQPLFLRISALHEDGQWHHFGIITNRIAREEVDPYLAYRLLKPLYNLYVNIGIYQRNLQSYEQQPVLENKAFASRWEPSLGKGCLNCHTFLNHSPDTFAINVRSDKAFKPMLLVISNEVKRVDKTFGYLSWHPSGRLLAFSANQMNLFFHSTGETRDVFNGSSDLGIYYIDSNKVVSPPCIAQPEINETWPAWSPDGRFLYFCSAAKMSPNYFASSRYSLMRVAFDLASDTWGQPETVVSSEDTGLSAAEPRVSPDGKWLLFCLCKYGSFPIYQPSSDLWLLDLRTLKYQKLPINSPQSESWHCWSSNSRWVVFSSKRSDGVFARPFFSYVDEDGNFHKPFLLPQEDPTFYESYLQTFNVPELLRGPVKTGQAELAKGVLDPLQGLSPTAQATQTPKGDE
jgi:hypothetical protein